MHLAIAFPSLAVQITYKNLFVFLKAVSEPWPHRLTSNGHPRADRRAWAEIKEFFPDLNTLIGTPETMPYFPFISLEEKQSYESLYEYEDRSSSEELLDTFNKWEKSGTNDIYGNRSKEIAQHGLYRVVRGIRPFYCISKD